MAQENERARVVSPPARAGAQRAPSSKTNSPEVRVNTKALGVGSPSRRKVVRTAKRQKFSVTERRDSVRKPFPFAIIFCFLVIVAVVMYVLSLRIAVDNYTASISEMESEIASSKEEQNALKVRLNAKYDLTEIERIATQDYGMVHKDMIKKKYISIAGEDEVEVLNPEQTSDPALLSILADSVDTLLA